MNKKKNPVEKTEKETVKKEVAQEQKPKQPVRKQVVRPSFEEKVSKYLNTPSSELISKFKAETISYLQSQKYLLGAKLSEKNEELKEASNSLEEAKYNINLEKISDVMSRKNYRESYLNSIINKTIKADQCNSDVDDVRTIRTNRRITCYF